VANNRLYIVAADGSRLRIAKSMGGGWEARRDLLEALDAFFTVDLDKGAALGNCFDKTELRLLAEND
jgi:hypothetical protein